MFIIVTPGPRLIEQSPSCTLPELWRVFALDANCQNWSCDHSQPQATKKGNPTMCPEEDRIRRSAELAKRPSSTHSMCLQSVLFFKCYHIG